MEEVIQQSSGNTKAKLYNRYNIDVTIERLKKTNWVLSIKDEFFRTGGFSEGDDRKGLSFVDPSGGPFISVDSFLSEYSKDLPGCLITQISFLSSDRESTENRFLLKTNSKNYKLSFDSNDYKLLYHINKRVREAEPLKSIYHILQAVHAVNPLRLEELAQADEFNFKHDISGILDHFNIKTGKFKNCFTPRYTQFKK